MKGSVFCVVPLLLSACSLLQPEHDPSRIVISNHSGELIYFAVFNVETLRRIDPIPAFDPNKNSLPSLEDDSSAHIPQAWDDLGILIYRLREVPGDEGPGGTRAVLTAEITVSYDELRRTRGRVAVGEL